MYLQSARRVHIGGDDGNAFPGFGRILELELAFQIDFGTAFQGGSFGANEDVLEVEFFTGLDFVHTRDAIDSYDISGFVYMDSPYNDF